MSVEGSAPGFRLADLIRHGAEPPPVARLTRLRSYPWLIVAVTCIGAFMGQVDASIVQLALPTLGRVFDSHPGERELGRARLSARRRRVHADLRSALPDLRQEAALHHRLCRVHRGERALRLCAGSRHADRVSVPARLRRGDAWSQQHGACRDFHGQKPARARAWRLCRSASGRNQRRSGYRRPAPGDIGLALGVLDQCALRAHRHRRQLVRASSDSAAESGPKVRLARRSPARARD